MRTAVAELRFAQLVQPMPGSEALRSFAAEARKAAKGRIEPFNGSTKISTFVAKFGKISTIESGSFKLSGGTAAKSLI
jgi:hypothetical protein